MSRTWKWILGILAVLVVVAIVAGAFWVLRNRSQMITSYKPYTAQPNPQGTPTVPNGQNLPMGPRGYGDGGRFPMGGWGFRGPMMGDGRFSHFGRFMPFGMDFFFLGGLFRLIIPLGLLALVAVLFYQMGKRAGISQAPAPMSSAQPAPSPAPTRDQKPAKKR